MEKLVSLEVSSLWMVLLLQGITRLQPFYKERSDQPLGVYGDIRVLLNQSTNF